MADIHDTETLVSDPETLRRAIAERAVALASIQGRTPWAEFEHHLAIAAAITARMDRALAEQAIGYAVTMFPKIAGRAIGEQAARENAAKADAARRGRDIDEKHVDGRPEPVLGPAFGRTRGPTMTERNRSANRDALRRGVAEVLARVMTEPPRASFPTPGDDRPLAAFAIPTMRGMIDLVCALEGKYRVSLADPGAWRTFGDVVDAVERARVEAGANARSGREAL